MKLINIPKFNLFNIFNPVVVSTRCKSHTYSPPKEWTNGVKYHGFTYYPRYPDEKDPPIEPAKLWMVQRIKRWSGNDYRLKKILMTIGFEERDKMSKVTIVKNIPEMNRELWKIKHLIKITPIKFLDGEPTADDLKYCHLNEWGELIIRKDISPSENDRLEQTNKFLNDPLHLDADTKIKDTRLKWLNPYK